MSTALVIREPSLGMLIPFGDRMRKVSLQPVVMGIPAQETITKDNVTRRPMKTVTN